MSILSCAFYLGDTVQTAQRLLGKYVVRMLDGRALVARIHEKNPPVTERAHKGEGIAQIPPSLAAKILFIARSEEVGMYPAELARRLNMKPQEVHRIYRLEHATKIDTINMALNAVGSRIALTVEPLEGDSSKKS